MNPALGLSRVGSCLAWKYQTRVEVGVSEKHSSLLRYGFNCDHKKFNAAEPRFGLMHFKQVLHLFQLKRKKENFFCHRPWLQNLCCNKLDRSSLSAHFAYLFRSESTREHLLQDVRLPGPCCMIYAQVVVCASNTRASLMQERSKAKKSLNNRVFDFVLNQFESFVENIKKFCLIDLYLDLGQHKLFFLCKSRHRRQIVCTALCEPRT